MAEDASFDGAVGGSRRRELWNQLVYLDAGYIGPDEPGIFMIGWTTI